MESAQHDRDLDPSFGSIKCVEHLEVYPVV